MLFRIAADLVALLHLAFVLFVVGGGLLAARRPWLRRLHLPAVAWGVLIELGGWICPLTPLENHLRHRAGEAGYTGGFVEHYLLPALYPDGLTRRGQLLLAALVVAVNLWAYRRLLRPARGRRAPGKA